ncbi:MAG: DUF2789 domain-containing protein [Oceanospirillales bacterium]|uniref:Uncharacterized protein DUF2789 n=1 Tax=Marinobacterium halophilum TaxID=267374 RepID=A0A2P8F4R4_9GAMM|nr:DUF2789 domain-containing protein [Marinobacterium halophilum]MBR9828083.1 DUF2789 domain-containing protein [Oceanospirillales bacterium]PSL16696.1 uncharacterized protein DUF2789 [Marinobacterium halophilum]
MDTSVHTLSALFEQLGLASSHEAIEQFINTHKLFSDDVLLHEASFWNDSQAAFLRDAITNDSDWAEVVDELNNSLHA